MAKDKQIKVLSINNIFNEAKYLIPIYQRNFAWGELEILQLLEDIIDSKGEYYLGNLIVDQKAANLYEVIDGQQRLTTLYLLDKYLKNPIPNDALRFEAREKSNDTLTYINKDDEYIKDGLKSEEIVNGYNIISKYFLMNKDKKTELKERLSSVMMVRIQVPDKVDLNHYFEIMNTRGEQLELHEIAKAKILEKLPTKLDKEVGSMIWDAASNMESYIQMNFDKDKRDKLFTKNWNNFDLNLKNFDDIKGKLFPKNINVLEENNDKRLVDILRNPGDIDIDSMVEDDDENIRFDSIISFPNLLLQVNKVIHLKDEDDSSLDDKNFLNNMQINWQDENKAKGFLYNLLKIRFLFDHYIIKREYARDYQEAGKWSLQKLKSYKVPSTKNIAPTYESTYELDDSYNKLLRTLQSSLRVTYTSPKTMHWISIVLSKLISNIDADLKMILEEYSVNKVKASQYGLASGFSYERIVFTYLDYILYRDGYVYNNQEIIPKQKEKWEFQFRNSIEHFYPQNPPDIKKEDQPSDKVKDSFGNLALITVSGNSKFSNLKPKSKVDTYPNIIEQSLKLHIMGHMLKSYDISIKDLVENHRIEMFKILGDEIENIEKRNK